VARRSAVAAAAVRWASRGATAAVWGGSAAALGTALVVVPAVLLVWKGLVLVGAGAAVASQQAGHAMFQRQLRKLARGDIPLSQLDAHAEGELVVVRGRIESRPGDDRGPGRHACVYRRMVWEPDGRWVSEAAIDSHGSTPAARCGCRPAARAG
jgi:hypothetical protein